LPTDNFASRNNQYKLALKTAPKTSSRGASQASGSAGTEGHVLIHHRIVSQFAPSVVSSSIAQKEIVQRAPCFKTLLFLLFFTTAIFLNTNSRVFLMFLQTVASLAQRKP